MAILCVHLGRAVQTPQPTLSMFPSSVSSLSPPRSVRFDLHATLYLANSSRRGMVKKVLFFLFFIFFFLSLSLSLSLLFSCPPPPLSSLPLPLSLSFSFSLFLSLSVFSVGGWTPARCKRSCWHWWDIGRWRKRESPLAVECPPHLPRGPPVR